LQHNRPRPHPSTLPPATPSPTWLHSPAEQPEGRGLVHSLAHSVGSRQRLARCLLDWGSFLLVPEGLSRELRGQGLAAWLRQHLWEHIRTPRQAPPGTAWVSGWGGAGWGGVGWGEVEGEVGWGRVGTEG